MENMTKKRPEVRGDGRITGKKLRSKKKRFNGGVTADDAELDEFLAIVNRLQAGFNHFQEKGAVKSAVKPTDPGLWKPAFELDDFRQLKDGGMKINGADAAQNENVVGFDLNADPVSD